ncbi:hypothetical protein BK659_16030 [Pseudomonas brassicacearum]|uniref:Uncharacterized protein n=1 Tax=Pseudomonas brassicacearum TaxID=930166 RepID=A0A423H6P7_9PSED|nr:hypothetical protein BK659_16030 [Pseudomonas brassicacearum]
MANDRAACRSEPAADSRVGFVASRRTDGATGSTAYTSANRCPRTSAKLLADDITQYATNAAADGCGTIPSGHCALCDQST